MVTQWEYAMLLIGKVDKGDGPRTRELEGSDYYGALMDRCYMKVRVTASPQRLSGATG